MANKTILMSRIRQLLRLYTQGKGKKQISNLTGIARNTVKKYLQLFSTLKLTYADIDALTDQELDQLFTPSPSPLKDERYEQLQKLLPDIEKQLKRERRYPP
jgi:DNA-binding transcriptional regulator LsrR (DeoR family)